MSQEDAMFKMADALLGVWSETGETDRYISDEDFDKCLLACKKVNPERYKKEIEIYF